MPKPVVLFCFAGRRQNMALQFRWVDTVLRLHPDVEYHCWTLPRNQADRKWLESVTGAGRAIMRREFTGRQKGSGYRKVWRAYAADRSYRNSVLVKVDDDLVFLDPRRFGEWIDAVRANPDAVVSADVINNGACNQLRPWVTPECNPIDTYTRGDCARLAHEWFLANWRDACTQPVELVEADLWLSINAVAMTHPVLRRMAHLLQTPCPPVIAGWRHGRTVFGDEGTANVLPRLIAKGVMAAHLSFEPQAPTDDEMNGWRDAYAEILEDVCSS